MEPAVCVQEPPGEVHQAAAFGVKGLSGDGILPYRSEHLTVCREGRRMGLGIPASEIESGDPLRQPPVGKGRKEDRFASGRGKRIEEVLIVEVEGGIPRHADPNASRSSAGFPYPDGGGGLGWSGIFFFRPFGKERSPAGEDAAPFPHGHSAPPPVSHRRRE